MATEVREVNTAARLPVSVQNRLIGGLRVSTTDLLIGVIVLASMLLGGYFRFQGNNWDDFVRFHPDERGLTQFIAPNLGGNLAMCFDSGPDCLNYMARVNDCRETYPATGGRGGYFDTNCSPYNPDNITLGQYVYGTLPLFMARISADYLADWLNDPTLNGGFGIQLVWRGMSALLDTLVIFLVFLMGRRMHNRWTGALAAFLYAVSVSPIQQAHFGTMDATTNFFVMLALWFIVRAVDSNRLLDYALFGVGLGAAVASRINVAPLAALVLVPAVIHTLPVFDRRLPLAQRDRLWIKPLVGVMVAAFASLLVFRIGNPYAFPGPGFFGVLGLDARYIEALEQARYSVSGEMDWAPNWQWVNRTPYLFAWQNMVIWGMGPLLGLLGWLSLVWAAIRLIRGRPGSVRNAALVIWVIGYFAFAGGLWVMSMRYYLPLYGPLTILAAWFMVDLVQGAWNRASAGRRRGLSAALVVGVSGFTLLWALMFTNIYRTMATFTQSGHYTWERISGDFAMRIDGADPETPLINVALPNADVSFNEPSLSESVVWPGGTRYQAIDDEIINEATRIRPGQTLTSYFYAPETGSVSEIRSHRMVGMTFDEWLSVDPVTGQERRNLRMSYDDAPRTVQVTVRINGRDEVLGTATFSGSFLAETHPLGESHSTVFDAPFNVLQGVIYVVEVTVLDGGPVLTSGAIMGTELPFDEVVPPRVCYPLPDGLTLADDPPSGLYTVGECSQLYPNTTWAGTPPLWERLVHVLELNIVAEDDAAKRDRLLTLLDRMDYVIINTNRRYDSQSRIPLRWPLTNAYYEGLFNGELGYEIEAVFQESFEFGPLQFSDQHLPHYDSPDWLNEFEPEEAFSVYDHPVVYFLRKSDDYSRARAEAYLDSVPLSRTGSVAGYNNPLIAPVMTISSLQADQAPTHLMFTDDMREIQREGGTWSDRFDSHSLLNTNHLLAVFGWWLVLLLFGAVTWPLLFIAFPGLADRGYGFAKLAGMLITAWVVWVLGTLRIPAWNRTGIVLVLMALALVSLRIVWLRRDDIWVFIRKRWHLVLAVEALTLLLFLGFVLVRMENPDLWHQSYGGEKPMDFAYFNGVLRSTIFPPIDPWFSGGYINYYYFGFVLVGVPTLLTGIMPSIAYNLIVPTLFALTGVGAFSLAFSAVSAWRREPRAEEAEQDGPEKPRLMGNPWVAGVMALMLAVILGNLGTAQVFVESVAQHGGWDRPIGFDRYLLDERIDSYVDQNGIPPDSETLAEMRQASFDEADSFTPFKWITYEVGNTTSLASSFFSGLTKWMGGEQMQVSPNRWFWGPTRTISEIPENNRDGYRRDGAINEMPYFTFLYGDLHAHMIALPMTLLVMMVVFHEVLASGRDRRAWPASALALGLGALTVGLLAATNTWDYPTYMILAIAGLGYAWWLRHWARTPETGNAAERLVLMLSRGSILDAIVRIGGFALLALLVALPFNWWFASGITEFKVWDGNKTPLWAYFTIHGLFLFLVVSLLVWETARWASTVRVRDLRGRILLLYGLVTGGCVVMLMGFVAALMDYQVALIVLPLVAWIALLFFRPGQSRVMQVMLVFIGLALSITLGTEIITLQFDNGRQNTIFKFYMQVWLLFSVAGGVGFAWVVSRSMHWRPRLAVPWYLVFTILFFVGLMYPLMATRGKNAYRINLDAPRSLDGLEYMRYSVHGEEAYLADPLTGYYESGSIQMINDYNAIRWLQDNVEGSPVIIEAVAAKVLYKWGGRISINTGLPSVAGWDYHQTQQRSVPPLQSLVSQRVANVNAFYTTQDESAALDILNYYDVRYIIVTDYEQMRYAHTGGLEKLDRWADRGVLRVAYQEGEATIYEVLPDMLDRMILARYDPDLSAYFIQDEANNESGSE